MLKTTDPYPLALQATGTATGSEPVGGAIKVQTLSVVYCITLTMLSSRLLLLRSRSSTIDHLTLCSRRFFGVRRGEKFPMQPHSKLLVKAKSECRYHYHYYPCATN